MRDAELQFLVFYKYKEITHPAAFVQEVLKLWAQDGREPFRLYTRTTPALEITQEMLEERLTFAKKDRTNRAKILCLKTSLKQNNIRASFSFSHPDCDLCDPLVQRQKGGSSIGIDVPLCEIRKKPYQIQKLMEFYNGLFSGRQVDHACIIVNGSIAIQEGIEQRLFDMLNYQHKKEYIIPCRRLDWSHFFTTSELSVIQDRFSGIAGGFETFCDNHGLYIQPLGQTNGSLLCMKCKPEDTLDFFQQLLRNNQDFWQVMKK